MVPSFEPTLATAGRPFRDLDERAVEPKLDGWRSIVTVNDGQLTVRTRHGRLITDCLLDLGPLAGTGDVVLDGDDGQVPAYKLGRVIRVRRSDLDAFLESVRVKPGELRHLLPGSYKKSAGPAEGAEA